VRKIIDTTYWHDPRWKQFVGATVKIRDLAENLSRLGHDVMLFLPAYGFKPINKDVNIVEIPFINIPILRFISFNIFLAMCLSGLLLKSRPRVIYVRRMGSIVPALFALITRSPFFYEVNDDPYQKDYHEGSKAVFKTRRYLSTWIDHLNIRFSSQSFVITEAIIGKIQKQLPNSADKLIHLPSGTNSKMFYPQDQVQCRRHFNMDTGLRYIGFAGSLLKHQGIDVLIDAAPELIREFPEIAFEVAGEGPQKITWKSGVTLRRLSTHFRFRGQIEYQDMPSWINATDICVAPFLPSAGLRSPVKIFDYMACAKPVIASRIPGTTDAFEESNAIILVSPGDSAELSRAIISLLKSPPETITNMGLKGRKFIERHYDRGSLALKVVEYARKNLITDK